MKENKKISALNICVILITTLIFSYIFVIENVHHDCSEHECPICLEIETALQLISDYKEMIYVMILSVIFLSVFALTCREDIFSASSKDTLITMKVKLLI